MRVYFHSHEPNEPPHVHVDRDQQSAKFWIAPVALSRNLGFGPAELRRIQRMLEEDPSLTLDHDGDLDIVLTNNGGPAKLFRNDGGNKNKWICIKTVGSKSNRDGIGAVIRIESASGKQWTMVRSGSSYCSQSDLTATFGLGKDAMVTAVDIEWPSGEKQHLTNIAANQIITVEEGKGIRK
mgnify:CR=1 FL=1